MFTVNCYRLSLLPTLLLINIPLRARVHSEKEVFELARQSGTRADITRAAVVVQTAIAFDRKPLRSFVPVFAPPSPIKIKKPPSIHLMNRCHTVCLSASYDHHTNNLPTMASQENKFEEVRLKSFTIILSLGCFVWDNLRVVDLQ